MGLFKRKRKDETPQTNTVVVKVPTTPTECVVPEEHVLLAKLRSLQGERVEINQFLKNNKLDKCVKTPTFDALVDLVSNIYAENCSPSLYVYHDEPKKRIIADRLKRELRPQISNIDFAAMQQEALQLKSFCDTIISKRKRLNDIENEINAIKSSLGISASE